MSQITEVGNPDASISESGEGFGQPVNGGIGAARGGPPVPRGVSVRRRREAARLWLPGLATFFGTVAFAGISDEVAVQAAVLAIVAITASKLLSSFPYPTRLMPASRMVLALLPLLTAAFASAALNAAGAHDFTVAFVLPGLLIGAVVAAAVEAVGDLALAANPLRIAVLGDPDFVPSIRRELDAVGGRREFEVVGWLNVMQRAQDGGEAQAEALRRVRAAIVEHEIDLLVRAPGSAAYRSGSNAYEMIAAGCLDLPVRMMEGNQLYEQTFGHVPIGTIESAWFLFLMHPRFHSVSRAWKRALDVVVSLIVSIFALPLVIAGGIAIKLGDGGPVFYRQRRVGADGQEFDILKLRTMSTDAQASGARWAAAADTRITPVGRVLRRLHIDELPQLVNVLKGEMTLVGPRPEQPSITAELERMFPHYSRRMLVKPGVTGWAQVRCGYAGSEVGTAWKLCHDLFYLKHRSVLADLLIMLETLMIAARDSHRPLRAPHPEFLYRPASSNGHVPAPSSEAPLDERVGHPVPAGMGAG